MRPVRVLALVFVGMLLLTACRIDATVSVRVQEDGSGTVRVRVVLDPVAVRAAESGDATLDGLVRLDDLPAAGWRVEPWVRRADGSAVLVVRHPFSSPEQLEAAMADLNGADGPLRAVRLERGSDPVRTTFDFRALADLAGLESGVASDQQLAANLSAQRVDVAGLDAALTARLRDALRMNVAVALPGGGTRVWRLPPGTRSVLETSSSQPDLVRITWLGSGVILGAAALALVFFGERKAGRRRRRVEPVGTSDTTQGTWPGST
ncbi:MAG: hypothetical protein ACXW2Y_05410 [Acidimicrobiia bacterium]